EVLGNDAFVLHRHLPARERNHPCAEGDVSVEERRSQQRLHRTLMLKARDGKPWHKKVAVPVSALSAETGTAGPGHRGSTSTVDPRGHTRRIRAPNGLNHLSKTFVRKSFSGTSRRAGRTGLRESRPRPRSARPAPRAER